MKTRLAKSFYVIAALVFCFLLPLLLLCGCGTVHVPTTEIRFPDGSYAKFPKQTTATNITVALTNGALFFHADWLDARNDQDVISATGVAEAAKVKATLEGSAAVAGAVAKEVISAAKKVK